MFRTAYEELRELTQLHSILSTRKFELDTTNITDFVVHQIEYMPADLITGWMKMGQIDMEFVKCLHEYNAKFCEKTIQKAVTDVCEANQIDEVLAVFSILIKESYYGIFIMGLHAVCNYAVEKESTADCLVLNGKVLEFIRKHNTDRFPKLWRCRMILIAEKLSP